MVKHVQAQGGRAASDLAEVVGSGLAFVELGVSDILAVQRPAVRVNCRAAPPGSGLSRRERTTRQFATLAEISAQIPAPQATLSQVRMLLDRLAPAGAPATNDGVGAAYVLPLSH